jgi:hypothetical protein
MSRQQWMMVVAVWLLIGAAASVLARARSNYQLGVPGLKMVDLPVYDTKGNIVNTNTVDLPVIVRDCVSKTMPISEEELSWLPPDTTYARRVYSSQDFQAMLSVVLMGTDRSSIHKPQICLTGQGWKITQSDRLTIPIQRPHPYDLPVMRLIASKELKSEDGRVGTWRSIYVFWFVADDQLTSGYGERMWWMARDLMLTGTLQRWAYVSCLAYCAPGEEEETYERMKRFLAAAVPEFQLAAGAPPPPSAGQPRAEALIPGNN